MIGSTHWNELPNDNNILLNGLTLKSDGCLDNFNFVGEKNNNNENVLMVLKAMTVYVNFQGKLKKKIIVKLL